MSFRPGACLPPTATALSLSRLASVPVALDLKKPSNAALYLFSQIPLSLIPRSHVLANPLTPIIFSSARPWGGRFLTLPRLIRPSSFASTRSRSRFPCHGLASEILVPDLIALCQAATRRNRNGQLHSHSTPNSAMSSSSDDDRPLARVNGNRRESRFFLCFFSFACAAAVLRHWRPSPSALKTKFPPACSWPPLLPPARMFANKVFFSPT